MAITTGMHRQYITIFMDASYESADKVELITPSSVFVQCRLDTPKAME